MNQELKWHLDYIRIMRKWHVYALSDPRTNAVRYIGWAFNPVKRLRDHVFKSKAAFTHKDNWLKQLTACGLSPILSVLESGTGNGWAECETKWIAHHRGAGANLVNSTDGGEGVVGLKFSQESRLKMSLAKKGKPLSPERRLLLDKARAMVRYTPEHCAKIAASKIGKKRSPETIAKLCGHGGWHHTDDARRAIGDAQLGRTMSEATKEILRSQRIGKSLSVEHRLKLSAAHIGKRLTEAHKLKISVSCKHVQRCGFCGGVGHKRGTCERLT